MGDSMEKEKNGILTKYQIDEKKEAIRNKKMRALLSQSIDLKETSEGGGDCVAETTSLIQKANEVSNTAQSSSTAYLDAQLLLTSSLIYKDAMEKMDSQISEFKYQEYAQHILTYLESKAGQRNIWEVLGDETSLSFNNTGGWSWMLGALDVEEGQIQQRTRQKRPNLVDAPTKNPKQVENAEKTDEDLEEIMKIISKIIEDWEMANKEPLQFWDLVLHPTSFAETIENIFYVSHLVKEGHVFLSLDRDGLPILKRIVKKSDGKSKGVASRMPAAITLDTKQWEVLVKAFKREVPMIPTRIPPET